MLISSMDQLNYYSMPKDGYLEIDTSAPGGYSIGLGPSSLMEPEEGSQSYMNEENSPKNGTKSSLYKTELCKRFSEFGSCRYGAKCQFAHGLAELRHVVRHPKYKTTKCKSYWGSGHCPYGSRCRFIHEELESTMQPPYSPPGSMSGLFLHDKNTNGMPELGGASTPGGYLYGPPGGGAGLMSNEIDEHEYSLLSGFQKNPATSPTTPWGSAPTTTRGMPANLSYTSEPFHNGASAGSPHHSMPQHIPVSTSAPSTSTTTYPDLQDAIDALMKFSLSPSNDDVAHRPVVSSPTRPVTSSSSLGTIASTPLQATEPRTKRTDYTLESDELWRDFPTLHHNSPVDFAHHKEWPAGLSLSLEGTGLFSNDQQLEEDKHHEGGNKTPSQDETSPRLSIFHRFH